MHLFIILSLAGMVANPQVSQWGYMAQEEDTFATYAYTFGDIVIFSYGDNNYCEILDDANNQVWSDMLHADEYHLQENLTPGVYEIIGFKPFSVLTGDPFNELVQGWYAVDENSRPLSTKFLTVIQGSWLFPSHAGEEKFCIFAYQDNTSVTAKDLDADTIIWEGDLDSTDYWHMRNPYANGIPVSVEATKPVSVLSYGDCGYYAPAFNGTFTGRDFITYSGDMGVTEPWPQALKVISWKDDVNVVVTDLDNPADTLWEFHIDDRGDVQSQNFVGRFLAVHADKDISCALVPGTTFNYFHLVRCIDRDGLGLGTLFYIPVYQTTAMMTGNLDIFAHYDNTEVGVFRLPENTQIWSGTLQGGEHHRLMTEYYATYKVEASHDVSVIESDGDIGADFLPLWFAIHPAIAAYPSPQLRETHPGVPVSETHDGRYELYIENNGNVFDVINMFATHSDPVNFTSVLTDEYGGSLPDCDGDGNPDTDTLARGQRVLVLVDVIPSDTVPVGRIDTCFFRVVSSRDTTKCDTAFLLTRIIPGSVSEKHVTARLPELSFAFGHNVLYVRNSSKEELRLDFFDVLGRRVMSRTIQESQASVDVSAFPKGVYFVSVRTGESERITRKVVVCR